MQMFAQERKKFRELFTEHISNQQSELSLGELALYLAGEDFPFLDIDRHIDQLAQIASQVRESAGDSKDQRSLIESLGHLLFEEMGFTGSTIDSLDPDLYSLNRVLDTHIGSSLTLSLVYLDVARRLGIKCNGVGLPGHFVVHLDTLDLYLDPYHSGQLLSNVDCHHLVREIVGDHLPWRSEFIALYNDRDILFRLLNNLKVIHMQKQNYARAADAVHRMVLINSSANYLHRDLAWCYFNTRNQPTALEHLEAYLRQCWPCPNETEMQYQVQSMWSAFHQSI